MKLTLEMRCLLARQWARGTNMPTWLRSSSGPSTSHTCRGVWDVEVNTKHSNLATPQRTVT